MMNQEKLIMFDHLGDALYHTILYVFNELDPNVQELGLLLLPEPTWLSDDQDQAEHHDTRDDVDDDQQSSSSSRRRQYHVNQLVQTTIAPALQLERSAFPVAPIVIQDHKLGLAYWCLSALFKSAHSKFVSLLDKYPEKKSSSSSGGDCDSMCHEDQELFLECTRCMLLINADCYTAWHRRKKILMSRMKSDVRGSDDELSEDNRVRFNAMLSQELQFLNLLGTKHPKSGESWHHRWWIIKQRIAMEVAATAKMNNNFAKDSSLFQLLDNEMKVAERMAVLYPRNYYSWTHRQLILKELVRLDSSLLLPMIESEWKRLEAWTRRNISDHSGFHHVILLLQLSYSDMIRLKEEQTEDMFLGRYVAMIRLVVQQLHYCQFMITFYPGHESLWIYRRLLWKFWIQLLNTERVRSMDESNTGLLCSFYSKNLCENNHRHDDKSSQSISFLQFIEYITDQCAREYERSGQSVDDDSSNTTVQQSDHLYAIPTLRNELFFAEMRIADTEVTDFVKQRKLALSYQVFVLDTASAFIPAFAIFTNENLMSPLESVLALDVLPPLSDPQSAVSSSLSDMKLVLLQEYCSKEKQVLQELERVDVSGVHRNLWRALFNSFTVRSDATLLREEKHESNEI